MPPHHLIDSSMSKHSPASIPAASSEHNHQGKSEKYFRQYSGVTGPRLHKPGQAFKELPTSALRDHYSPPSKTNSNLACITKNNHSLVREHIIFDTLSSSALTAHRNMTSLITFILQFPKPRVTYCSIHR